MRDRSGCSALARVGRAVLALQAAASLSCLHAVPTDACSGAATPLDALRPERLHVRVLLEHDGRSQRHEVVVEARPGRVEATGLTPFGTRAYHLARDRDGITVENRVGSHLSLSPRLAYDAIARAYLTPSGAQAAAETRVERPECGYTARLVLVSRQPLGVTVPASPAKDEPRRP